MARKEIWGKAFHSQRTGEMRQCLSAFYLQSLEISFQQLVSTAAGYHQFQYKPVLLASTSMAPALTHPRYTYN